MRKTILMLLTAFGLTALLAGCGCQHTWLEADCDTPKTCSKCAAVEGEALGHSWTEADCEHPRTCSVCTLTEGNALGHDWLDATCTAARTCRTCSATEGDPLEHDWTGEATLYEGPLCAICGAEGDPLPGYFVQNGLTINALPQQEAEYITGTYVRPDLDTVGQFFSSGVMIMESDDTHRAKKGYEWRTVDIIITFSDSNSGIYGTDVVCSRADYYQDLELKQANKQDRFRITYNGKEYQCLATYENVGFHYTDNSNIFQMSCYVQVPVGYDGFVLAFTHGSIDIDGMHLHEVDDENMLLFRLA